MKLSKELIDSLVELIAKGNYAKDACGYMGVSEELFYYWKKNGKNLYKKYEKEEIKKEELTEYQSLLLYFFQCLKKAEKAAIIEAVAVIKTAAKDQWQAAAWYLERRAYQDWGRKDKIEIKGKMKYENMSDTEIDDKITELTAIISKERNDK